MKRILLLLYVLTFSSILTRTQAEIEFTYTIKEKAYLQYGNLPAETIREWNFGAGVSGDSQVTGGSVTYPGGSGAFSGESGEFDLDRDEDFTSQAQLDAAYPNGDITLSITDGGANQNYGPFSLTGDAYPERPHILNAVAIQTADFSQDFILKWAPFDGADPDDQIIIQIWDENTDEDVVFDFIEDASTTSYTIPGGSFSANNTYEVDILFINQTVPAPEGLNAIIGYITSTRVNISTFPQNYEDNEGLLSRGIFAQQTNSTVPTSGTYIYLAEAYGAGFSSATLIKPDNSEVEIEEDNQPMQFGDFELGEMFASEAERDAAYPEGNYSIRIVDNGNTTTHGPYNHSGAATPVIPGITNWDAAQAIDPDEDFTLNWTSFSNAGDEAYLTLEIWNNSNGANEMEWDFESDAQSLTIPSSFLQPNSTYTGELIFVNPAISPQNSSGVTIEVLYETFTEFTLQTGDGAGGVSSDTTLVFYKWKRNLQTAPGSLQDDGYRPLSTVTGNSLPVTSAQLNSPSGSMTLDPSGPDAFSLPGSFGSKEALDADYPDGDYHFALTENGSAANYGPYTLPPDDYPLAPVFENFDALQNFDSQQNQPIRWSTPPDGLTSIRVSVVEFFGAAVWQTTLDPTAVSTQLPANALAPDTQYYLVVQFFSRKTGGSNPAASLGYITSTRMQVHTSSDGGGGGPDVEGLFLVAIKVKNYLQENSFQPVFEIWEAFAQANDDENPVQAFTLLTPDGSLVIEEEDGFFEDEMFYDSQEIMDAENPSGDYTFRVTQNGVSNDFGPYNLSGDSYADPPYITNFAALQGFDTSQDITVQFTGFAGASGDDILAFSIETDDSFGGDDPVFEFIDDLTTTSYLIPANTLQPNRRYRGRIIFGNITGYSESSPFTLVGYSTELEFPISTFPQYDSRNQLDIWFSKGVYGHQTSDQPPATESWFFLSEVEVAGLTAASMKLPSGNDELLATSNQEPGLFFYEANYPDEASLDAAFPDGEYQTTITVNGMESTYGPFNLAGGSPPDLPYFTNFNDLQNADPSQPITLTWNPFNNPPQNARIGLEIDGAPGYSDLEVDISVQAVTDTSAVIPANTLEPNSKYIVHLFFESPSQTGSDPEIFAGYETYVQAAFRTSAALTGSPPATDLTVQIENSNSVRLNWMDNSGDESGFRIERKAIWEDQWSILSSVNADETTFFDNSVQLGEAYRYRVVVFNASGDGGRSNEAEVRLQPPNEPTGLQVDPYNSNTITVSWDDNSKGESGFEIDRSTDGNDWSNAGNTGSNVNVFIDSGLDSDTTYIYRVRAISGLGSSNESEAGSDSTYQATSGKPVNISTRGTIGSGDDLIMIAGFIISGNESKDILIRGIAPTLTGVNVALLQDPELVLFDGADQIDQNNDWEDHSRAADITATGIPPQDPKEAAIFTTLQPGIPYTVWMRGADGGEGAGLVEVYEANAANDAKLINISTRGITAAGDGVMIAGVIVQGTGNRTLYITGKGPSLPSNLTGRLVDPKLTLVNTTDPVHPIEIAQNDNWQDNGNFAGIVATTIPPVFPEEAALLVNVPPGSYTIKLEGSADEEGLAIIEVFEVPDTL